MTVTFDEHELFRFVLALGLVLAAAHAGGALFARFRQPRAIGEIAGGFLLGGTVLGALAPAVQAQLIPSTGPAPSAIAAVGQLGLAWLMFVTGTELRTPPLASQKQASLAVAFAGVALPLAAGLLTFALLHPAGLEGSAHSTAALGIVFAAALALTSIPVISRIMMDLGLLSTSFARIVLGAAVIEDVVLFGLLGIAVGLSESAAETTGLAALIGVPPDSPIGAVYLTD
jgi:Kef-type K+ transport system membrane component KefB